jgi:PilZ domain
MKKRPIQILILAWIQWLDPVANVLINAAYFHVSPWTIMHAAWMNSSWYGRMTFFFLGPILGLAIYAIKEWSFLVAALCVSLVFGQNAWNWYSHWHQVSWALLIGTTGLQMLLFGYLLMPKVRSTYFDRRIRWWEHKPRYRVTLSCSVTKSDTDFTCDIFNISEDGLFLMTKRRGLKPGDAIIVKLDWDASQPPIPAQIVHNATLDGNKGVGVQFSHTPESRKQMKQCIRQLKKDKIISSLETRDYLKETKEFAVNALKGKGLMPELPEKYYPMEKKDGKLKRA